MQYFSLIIFFLHLILAPIIPFHIFHGLQYLYGMLSHNSLNSPMQLSTFSLLTTILIHSVMKLICFLIFFLSRAHPFPSQSHSSFTSIYFMAFLSLHVFICPKHTLDLPNNDVPHPQSLSSLLYSSFIFPAFISHVSIQCFYLHMHPQQAVTHQFILHFGPFIRN